MSYNTAVSITVVISVDVIILSLKGCSLTKDDLSYDKTKFT